MCGLWEKKTRGSGKGRSTKNHLQIKKVLIQVIGKGYEKRQWVANGRKQRKDFSRFCKQQAEFLEDAHGIMMKDHSSKRSTNPLDNIQEC
jgi:hypothetical protein